MKILGKLLLWKIVETMEPGLEYYISRDAIEITQDNQLYLNLNAVVNPKMDDPYLISIKKLSQEEGDYKIDLSTIPYGICPLSRRIDLKSKKYKKYIGPYSIETEEYSQTAVWNRLETEELQELMKDLQQQEDKESYLMMAQIRDIINGRKKLKNNTN